MIIDVSHISRKAFKSMNVYNTLKNLKKNDYCYISIYGTDYYESKIPYINNNFWFSGIQLQFDDIEPSYMMKNEIPFSNKHAYDIIRFSNSIHQHPNPLKFIIHCFAGISRSAAVAKWINDFYDLGITDYHDHPTYNHHVYNTLRNQQDTDNRLIS